MKIYEECVICIIIETVWNYKRIVYMFLFLSIDVLWFCLGWLEFCHYIFHINLLINTLSENLRIYNRVNSCFLCWCRDFMICSLVYMKIIRWRWKNIADFGGQGSSYQTKNPPPVFYWGGLSPAHRHPLTLL